MPYCLGTTNTDPSIPQIGRIQGNKKSGPNLIKLFTNKCRISQFLLTLGDENQRTRAILALKSNEEDGK